MNRKDIVNVLSLSCVENYFLGFFNNVFDTRVLYVKSFVSFNETIDLFLKEKMRYENYSLERVQDVSENLGLTNHLLNKKFEYHDGGLNLIRVNERFYENSKILPWRKDHYIVIEKDKDIFSYLNNYPLVKVDVSYDWILSVYGGMGLYFYMNNRFNKARYNYLRDLQFDLINETETKDIEIGRDDIITLRDSLLVLKTLRKRMIDWLIYESDNGNFDNNFSFNLQSEQLMKEYNDLLVLIQILMLRGRINLDAINEKLLQLCQQERNWNKMIKEIRGI